MILFLAFYIPTWSHKWPKVEKVLTRTSASGSRNIYKIKKKNVKIKIKYNVLLEDIKVDEKKKKRKEIKPIKITKA